ncbi:MAG: phospholipase D family protein [Proteobacteria bacterium]|nr:phospholipase D family protein [Pseudomonadota bacterium]
MERNKIQILGNGELPSIFEDLVSDSIEISIASAFLNFAGLNILKKYLEKYNQVKSVRILLDENFHHEESTKKDLLIKLCALPNTEVRVFSDSNRNFHAKIYIFGGEESVDVIVGSSNLTSGGLLHNVEVNTLFAAKAADPEIVKLKDFYQKCWEKSQPAGVFLRTLGGGMGIYNFKIGDKVVISSKLEFGIGTIVGIEGEQADVFFREKGIAETAHITDLQSALEPLD